MEEPTYRLSCDDDEVAIPKSVVEQVFRGIMNGLLEKSWKIQVGDAGMAETGADAAAHSGGKTPAENIVALEKVGRLMQLGMVDFDTSELHTFGRVRVTCRSAEILEFIPRNLFAENT